MSHVQEAMMNAAQVPSSKRPQFSGIEASSASLGGLDAIMVQPVEGHFSRFFGQSEVVLPTLRLCLVWSGFAKC